MDNLAHYSELERPDLLHYDDEYNFAYLRSDGDFDADLFRNDSRTQRAQAQTLFDLIDWTKHRRVLDLGCGMGALSIQAWLHNEEMQLLALDRDQAKLDLGKAALERLFEYRHQHANNIPYNQADPYLDSQRALAIAPIIDLFCEGDIEFRCADMNRLNYCKIFDLIISNSAIHWAKQAKDCYRSLFEALRDGGELAVHQGLAGNYRELHQLAERALAELAWGDRLKGWRFPSYYPSAAELRQLLDEVGFTNVFMRELDYRMPVADLLDDFIEASLPYYREIGLSDVEYELFVAKFRELVTQEPLDSCRAHRIYFRAERPQCLRVCHRYALTLRERTELCDLLRASDRDFVPALSARRDGAMQQDFSNVSSSRGDISTYFDSIRWQEFMLGKLNSQLVSVLAFKPRYYCKLLPRLTCCAYITTIVTAQKYRGRGYASILLEELEADLQRNGTRRILIRSWSTNVAQLKILKNYGYEEVLRLKNDRGPGIDTVYFVKRLASYLQKP